MALGNIIPFVRPRRRPPQRARSRARSRLPLAIALVIITAAGFAARAPGAHETGRPGGNDIVGQARILDGDTLDVGGIRVRLFGIDAPEAQQSCRDANGDTYACGQSASRALSDLIHGDAVRCDQRDIDPYGRIVGVCSVDGKDINAALVETGLAVAYRQYSLAYVPTEMGARFKRRGLWAGDFQMPWDYRHQGN